MSGLPACAFCGAAVVALSGQGVDLSGMPGLAVGAWAHHACADRAGELPACAARWRSTDPGVTVLRTADVEVVRSLPERRITVYGAWGRISAAPQEWQIRQWVRGVVRLTRRHRLDLDLGGHPEVAARLASDFAARRPWTVPQILEALGAPASHPEVLDRSVISTGRPESPFTGTAFHLHAVYDEFVPRVADEALRRALES